MPNYKSLMRKLQTALAQRGECVSVTSLSVWSEKAGRMLTKWVLSRKADGKYHAIYETWQAPDMVKHMVSIYNGEGNANNGT